MPTTLGIVQASLYNLWGGVAAFVPNLIVAIVLLILGLIVAYGLGLLVERIIRGIRLDAALTRIGAKTFFDRAGMRMDSGWFFGQLVYWFILIGFLLAIFDVLHLGAASNFLRMVVNYIPNVIAAVLIIIAAALVAAALEKIVKGAVMSAGLKAASFSGALTRWAVFLLGLFAALDQLGIASSLINIVVGGFVFMVALAGGIAFGLGGKDFATSVMETVKEDLGHQR